MGSKANGRRVDSASRVIRATPAVIYAALIDPAALVAWRPPAGMTGTMHEFDPRVGGAYRMDLTYTSTDHPARGKAGDDVDVVQGRFLALEPNQRVVELVTFAADDPAFAGEMTVTTTLAPVPDGIEVTIACANVPPGIKPEEHAAGIASTLENLAHFTEAGGSTSPAG